MTDGATSTPASTELAIPTFIDTSLWIEAFRRGGCPSARSAVADLVEAGLAVVNGLIVSEVLRGARDERDYARLELLLSATTSVGFTPATWQRAARLGFDLRSDGLTVPTIDLAIASCALEEGFALAHRDRDFVLIAAHTPLQERFVSFDG